MTGPAQNAYLGWLGARYNESTDTYELKDREGTVTAWCSAEEMRRLRLAYQAERRAS